MAVGTTTNFNLGRNELITEALRILRVISGQQTASGDLITSCSTTLNLMLRAWQADGLHVWTAQNGCLFQVTGQATYNTSADRFCDLDDLVISALGADEASGQTVLTLSSTTGMAADDEIGILLDDGTLQWTTIASVDSSTQVTVDDALTGDASEDAVVYAFTTRLGRIVEINHDDSRIRNMTAATGTATQYNEIPLFPLSRQEYNILSNKTNQGVTTQLYFQALRDSANFTLWPVPNNSINLILFTYYRNLYDFDTPTDFADAPVEWTRTFIWCLAAELGPRFGVPPDRLAEIVARANSMRDNLLGWDDDGYSIRMQPDFHGENPF